MILNLKKFPSVVFILSASSLISCTTTKSPEAPKPADPVANPSAAAPSESSEDLPAELKDARNFDPAATLDQSTVQNSDFYQIKQSVEQNKNALDSGWREQERMESSVKAFDSAEKRRQELENKRDEEERERQRQQSIQEFEKTKGQRAKDEEDAGENAKKLPTIHQDEVQWKGLED